MGAILALAPLLGGSEGRQVGQTSDLDGALLPLLYNRPWPLLQTLVKIPRRNVGQRRLPIPVLTGLDVDRQETKVLPLSHASPPQTDRETAVKI